MHGQQMHKVFKREDELTMKSHQNHREQTSKEKPLQNVLKC